MNVNIEEIKLKLYEKLKPSGWGDKLKTFILSSDFDKILETLYKESVAGQHFTPVIKYLFTAFENCPYDDTRVVIIGQDPYPYVDVPDGMAFSCSIKKRPESSLRYIFEQIQTTVYPDEVIEQNPDLTRWANQGVLLLNSALTVPIGKPGYHQILWRPFMAFLFDIIGWHRPGMIYLFMGSVAKQWSDSIPDNTHKIFVSHPASAAYLMKPTWDSQGCFPQINELLLKEGYPRIIW
jgi:uracil-DNA glycosylase